MEVMMALKFVGTWILLLLPFVIYVWLCKLFSDRLCKQAVAYSFKHCIGIALGGLIISGYVFLLMFQVFKTSLSMDEIVYILNIPYTMFMQLFSYTKESTGMALMIPLAMQIVLIIYSIVIFAILSIFDYKKRTCAFALLCLAHVLSFLITYGIQFMSITLLLGYIPKY